MQPKPVVVLIVCGVMVLTAGCNSRIDELEGQVSRLSNNVSKLERKLKETRSALRTVESEAGALETVVADLSDALDDLRNLDCRAAIPRMRSAFNGAVTVAERVKDAVSEAVSAAD